MKWNVYNEVLVELWEWLTSSHSFMLPNYKYAAWLFWCNFHNVDMSFSHHKLESRMCLCECDGQRYHICILNLQLKWACTVYVHYVSAQGSLESWQNEQSYTCNTIFSASWRVNKLIPRNAVTTAVVMPRHLFKNILPFNSVYIGSLCYSSLSVFVDII